MRIAAIGAPRPAGTALGAAIILAIASLALAGEAPPEGELAAEPAAVIELGALEATTLETTTLETVALEIEEGGPQIGRVTKQPLPRFVSLRANEINVRRGPGLKYRKDWVFRRAGLPVLVIEEYGDWRQIVDSDNAGGWVYHSLLSRRRTVLVTQALAEFRAKPDPAAPVRARAEEGVVGRLVECRGDWCEVDLGSGQGWTPKSALWGVDPEESWPR